MMRSSETGKTEIGPRQTDYAADTFSFGPFTVLIGQRQLLKGDEPINIGSRAFDVLVALVRRNGQLATKDELLAEAWPTTIVQEENLKAQISRLRKLISSDPGCPRWLVTVPGRGYRFVAPVETRKSARRDADHPSRDEMPAAGLQLPERPSIAVLPFSNLSGNPEQGYLADGVAEEIITALARFSSLFVVARNSSFSYKGRAVDVRQVGRELGVRYLLEGSVRRFGDHVRVTGQLVETEVGTHVWADRYDSDLADLFALQDQMAASIVGALVPGLQQAEIKRTRLKPPGSLGAYDYYLRAMAAYYTWDKPGNDQALMLLEQSLALDPHFVPALILTENCRSLRYTRGWSPAAEALGASECFARLAVQLDSDNADALAVLSRRIASINRDYEKAIELAQRAVASNPNSSYAWRHTGWAYAFAGWSEEALAHFEKAIRLSPREAVIHDVASPLNGMALAYIQLGRDAEAISAAKRSIQQNPESAGAWRMLSSALALSGRIDEARRAVSEVLRLDPTCSLQSLYIRFGHSERARARFFDGLRKAGMPA